MSSFKLSLRNYRNTGILLGAILVGLILVQVIILAVSYNANKDLILDSPDSITLTINGLDFLFAFVIFIMACSNFKLNFHIQIQNNISRKTQFKNLLLSGATFCGICSFVHTVIYAIANPAFTSFYLNNFNFADASAGLSYEMFGSYYHSLFFAPNDLTFTNLVWTFLLMLTECVMLYILGCLCANISYRLPNYFMKLVVFGTPVLIFIIVPSVLDSLLFNGKFAMTAIDFIFAINGYTTLEAWKNVCTNIVVSGVLATALFLIYKKTPIKK